MFGHDISLNFNKKGDTFNTPLGGIVSIITKIVLLLYLGQQTIKLFTKSNNIISTQTLPTNYTETGEVSLQGEKSLIFFYIHNEADGPGFDFEGATKYFLPRILSFKVVYDDNNPNWNIETINFRKCNKEDF